MGGQSAAIPNSADFLIERLDQLDLRLRQLEEKQTLLPQAYFSSDLLCQSGTNTATAAVASPPKQCRTLSSALHQVRIKGTLMDRLHLLETRITQLSAQLDKDGSTTAGRQALLNDQNGSVRPGRLMGDVLPKGNPELQAHKCRKKVKDSEEAIDAVEKIGSATCRNDKRRMERTRIYKRWFPVGC